MSKIDQSAGGQCPNGRCEHLLIAGEEYERGVGTHAESWLPDKIGWKDHLFTAWVGIDDSAPKVELDQASAEFLVIGDGKILWRSGIMRGGGK